VCSTSSTRSGTFSSPLGPRSRRTTPLTSRSNTLYVYPITGLLGEPDVGDPPSLREDFVVEAVYVADNQGEEANRRRSRDVSVELDAKAREYTDLLARNPFRDGTHPWEHARVTSVDWDRLRQLDVRGIAVRVTGWRYRETA
jgi:hypothetical protein